MALVACRICGGNVARRARRCPHCGIKKPGKGFMARHPLLMMFAVLLVVGLLAQERNTSPPSSQSEPTKASESRCARLTLAEALRRCLTSEKLTEADLAWHAVNTYGWDCEEVIFRGPQQRDA